MHTINASLALVQRLVRFHHLIRAQRQPNRSAQPIQVRVRITAGSAEDVRLKSVRFYQAGSAVPGDLSNVMVYVDGTAYPTTVSTDGKYYSANLGSGIVIAKGLAKTFGSRATSLVLVQLAAQSTLTSRRIPMSMLQGETYGYGNHRKRYHYHFDSFTQRFCDDFVSAGSFTQVQKSTSVAAQNIAINLASQPLVDTKQTLQEKLSLSVTCIYCYEFGIN